MNQVNNETKMERFDLRRLLSMPALYGLFQSFIGAERSRTILFRDHIRLLASRTVLDLGCGPAPILSTLPPDVTYVGVDLNEKYVSATAARLETRPATEPTSKAIRADVNVFLRENQDKYDTVLAIGLLHHLDDTGASELLELSRNALKPGGSLITFDGVYRAGQSIAERLILNLDRGAFVRTVDEFESLVPADYELSSTVRTDLLRIPYTHLIMQCRLLDR